MSLDNAKNFAKVTVSTGYNAAATTVVLSGGHGLLLPTVPFNAVWWNVTTYSDPSDDPNKEIVRVTNISTDTLTVTRAQESTAASTKNTAGKTYKMIAGLTAKTMNTDFPATLQYKVFYTVGSANADYVTSNYASDDLAIQAAVTAANAASPSGGIIFLKPGTYTFVSPVVLQSNIELVGSGQANTVLTTTTLTASNHRGLITLSNKNNVVIRNLTFNVNVANAVTAITSYGHDTLTIENCGFTGISTYSIIELEGNLGTASFNNTIIERNRFYSFAASIRNINLYPRSGNIIERTKILNNHFENTKGPAIYIDDYDTCRDILVDGNTFKNIISGTTSTTPGVALFAGLANLNYDIHDVRFTNNHYYNTQTTGAGQNQGVVWAYAMTDLIISGNECIGSWTTSQNTIGPCFAPGRTSTPIKGLIISDNYIEGFDAPWDPDSMIQVDVHDNEVRNCGQGFDLGYGTQNYVKIHDNIHYNSGHRTYNTFLLFGNSTPLKCEIYDNRYVDDNAVPTVTYPIELTGGFNFTDVIVRGNRFYMPSGTFNPATLFKKELGTETSPTDVLLNELVDVTGTIVDAFNKIGLSTSNVITANVATFNLNGTNTFYLKDSSTYREIQTLNNTPLVINRQGNNVGINNVTSPTAYLHIAAGTAAASHAPLKFTSGTLLTSAEAGAVEFLTDAFYGTITTGAARKTFAFLEGPAFTGNPTAATQAQNDNSTKLATTAYVDLAALGQNYKEACRVATTGNLIGTYLAGVFTYTATGTDSIDGVTLVLNDRVLVKNQTDTTQNGIYKVTTAGALGIAGVLTRATDANASVEFKTGDAVFVTAGTTQTSTTWAYTGVDSPTLGTDAITYAQIAGQGSFTGGNGITITGTSIAIDTTITADLSTAQTFTNKTLTSPKINENVALTTTATKLNYLTSAGGTTGTTSTNIVFSTSPVLTTPTLGVASATALTLSGNISAASWTTNGIQQKNSAATFTDTDSAGTRATAVMTSFGTPTLVGTNAVTITDAATVYIAADPVASTNITLTNKYALWIDSGNSRFDGSVGIGTGSAAPAALLEITGTSTEGLRITNNQSVSFLTYYNGGSQYFGLTYKVGYVELQTFTSTPLSINPQGNKLAIAGATVPTQDLSLGGNSTRVIWMERHTTSNTAGNSLTIQAGGATSGATNKSGGNLVLQSAVSTGSGISSILFQTSPGTAASTSDNTLITQMTINDGGVSGNIISQSIEPPNSVSMPANTSSIVAGGQYTLDSNISLTIGLGSVFRIIV